MHNEIVILRSVRMRIGKIREVLSLSHDAIYNLYGPQQALLQ